MSGKEIIVDSKNKVIKLTDKADYLVRFDDKLSQEEAVVVSFEGSPGIISIMDTTFIKSLKINFPTRGSFVGGINFKDCSFNGGVFVNAAKDHNLRIGKIRLRDTAFDSFSISGRNKDDLLTCHSLVVDNVFGGFSVDNLVIDELFFSREIGGYYPDGDKLTLSNSILNSVVSKNDAIFNSKVSMENCTVKSLFFESVEFHSSFYFSGNFSRSGSCNFIGVNFHSHVEFEINQELIEQSKDVDFDFHGSSFYENLDFYRVNFNGKVNFHECMFDNIPPSFTRVEHKGQFVFPSPEVFLVNEKNIIGQKDVVDLEQRYRRLFNFTRTFNDKSISGVLYASMMRCRLKRNELFWVSKGFLFLYNFISNCWADYAKAGFLILFFLIIFLLLPFICFFIFVVICYFIPSHYYLPSLQYLQRYYDFIFPQLFQPFKIWSICHYTIIIKLLASLFSCVFYILLWLFVLALRWNFKKE